MSGCAIGGEFIDEYEGGTCPHAAGERLGRVRIAGWLSMRLKKLRRERHLVERAIIALTEISRNARDRENRRATRN